jgi:hypothetical protein
LSADAITALEASLQGEIAATELSLQGEIAATEISLQGEIAAATSGLQQDISTLDPATSFTGSDTLAIVQGGDTVQLPVTAITGYARTAAEIAASVTPSAGGWAYPPGDVRRYGAVGDGVASSSAAFTNAISVAAAQGGGEIRVPAGTYLVAGLSVNVSDITFVGEGRGVSFLKLNADSDLVTFTSAAGEINRCGMRDMTLLPNGYTRSGIVITGSNPNDFHNFERLQLIGSTAASGGDGFYRSIKVDGRMIWCRFTDIDIRYDRETGFWMESAGAINLNSFFNVRVFRSQKHGIHLKKTTGSNYHHSNNFYSCNPEFNGYDTTLSKNSGFYFYDVGETVLSGCYVEENGTGSADNLDAAVRTEGTWGGVSIYGGIYWGSDYSLKLDATLGWGHIDGCRIAAAVKGIEVNATNSSSRITMGGIYESNTPSGGQGVSAPVNVNADNFFASLIPFKLPLSSETDAALNLADKSLLRYANSSPVTLADTDLGNAAPGHLLWVCNQGSSTVTLTHGASLAIPGSASLILAAGQSAMLAKVTATKWVVLWWSHDLSGVYTTSNVTTDRSFNADSTTLEELADVLGTLIADLKTSKIIR